MPVLKLNRAIATLNTDLDQNGVPTKNTSKIKAIKLVREATNWGLVDAKNFVEGESIEISDPGTARELQKKIESVFWDYDVQVLYSGPIPLDNSRPALTNPAPPVIVPDTTGEVDFIIDKVRELVNKRSVDYVTGWLEGYKENRKAAARAEALNPPKRKFNLED